MVSDFDLVYSNLGYWSGKCPAFSEPLSKSECQKVARTGGGSFTTITNDYTMGACSVICGDLDQSKNWRCAGRSPEVRWNTIKKPSSTIGFQSILRNVCKRPCPQQDLEWVLNDIASTCPSGARNLLGENECRRGAASLGLNFTADDSKMYSGTMHFNYGTRWGPPRPWVCRNNGAKASSPTCTKRVDGSVRFTQCSYAGDQRVCGAITSTAEQGPVIWPR